MNEPMSSLHSTTGSDEATLIRSYGDVQAEYAALRHGVDGGRGGGAIVVDRSGRSRGTFSGSKAREVLTGLLTNDVLSVSPGEGCYAAALTPKGKIIADVRLFVRADDVLVDVAPRAAAGWWTMIRKYVNPRLSRYADISAATADIGVYGVRAHAVLASAIGVSWESLGNMGDFTHRTVDALGQAMVVARVPDLGLEGFAVFLPVEGRAALWESLRSHGARPAGQDAFTIARIESGRAEWGIEIDDTTLAQEGNFEELQAISYTKGCYTGQETVARVHFRGHVNRQLRGLRYAEERLIPLRAELHDGTGKLVGDVRSAAVSPRLGGIALAMVRREVELEAEVDVVLANGRVKARVVALPFPHG